MDNLRTGLVPSKRHSIQPIRGVGGGQWTIHPNTQWGAYSSYVLTTEGGIFTTEGGILGPERRVETNIILDMMMPMDQIRGMVPVAGSDTGENEVPVRKEPSTPPFVGAGVGGGK